jgi:immune inhibitor A
MIIPNNNDVFSHTSTHDEGASNPGDEIVPPESINDDMDISDITQDFSFTNDNNVNDPDDFFSVYELMYPEHDEQYTEEYFELTEKFRARNMANGWNNAGPPWYAPPSNEYLGFDIPAKNTRSVQTGKDRLIAIPINFTDSDSDPLHEPDAHTPKFFNETILFNTSSTAYSMTNFFNEASYNTYNISGEVAKNSSNTNGWYTAAYNESYYGSNEFDNTPPVGYGNAKDLVKEAVLLADVDINYSWYDVDNNNVVDHIMIIHAGQDDANDSGGGPTGDPQIWSHRGGVGVMTNDINPITGLNVWVVGYTMLAEKSRMGVYAHEYGHDVYLPDLYNISKGPDPVKKWDVMAGGAYNLYNGKYLPAHFSTWCKEYLGWHKPIVINETNNNQGIKNVRCTSSPTNENTSFKVNLPNSNEWFYVENRWKNTSSYDAGLPDSGIVIWHFDDDKPGNYVTPAMLVPENANPSIPTLNDAAFTSDDSQVLFNSTTSPNSTYNNGTKTMIHMDMINKSGPDQRIRILLTGDPTPPGESSISSIQDVPMDNGNEINISWTRSNDDGTGANDVKCYNIYINDTGEGINGKKHLIYSYPSEGIPVYSYIIKGLADGVLYHFSIKADDGPNESNWSNNASGMSYDNIANSPTTLLAIDTLADDGGNISLSWTLSPDDSLDIVGYNISMNDTGIIATLGPGITNYKVGNLTNGIIYEFNVSAFDEVFNIGYSNNATASPIDDYVGKPTGLSSNPSSWNSSNSFTLTWTNPKDNAGIQGVYYKYDSLPTTPTDGQYQAGSDISQLSNRWVNGSGIHQIFVWLEDGEGNKNHTIRASTFLFYDSLAPDQPQNLKVNPSGWTNVNSFDINWTIPFDLTNISGGYYTMDTPPTDFDDGTPFFGWNITELKSIAVPDDNNIHDLYIWLSDGLNNINHLNYSMVKLYFDETVPDPPSNIQVTPSGWTNQDNFSISWENPMDLSGIVGAYYKLYDPPNTPTNGIYVNGDDLTDIATIQVGTEGSHTIYVWLIDNATNVDHINRASVTVNYDRSPPPEPEDIKASPSGWTSESEFLFNWTNPTDLSGISGVYYTYGTPPTHNKDGFYVEGSDINNLTQITIDLVGTVSVYFWLNDSAGNLDYTNFNTTKVRRDIEPPTKPVNLIVTPPTWTNKNDFALQWQNPSDTSGIKGARYTLDSPPSNNQDGDIMWGDNIFKIPQVSVLGSGVHTIYIWLVDYANNTNYLNYNSTELKFDDQAPGVPKNLISDPPGWNSQNPFILKWENPVDLSGISGAYHKVGSPPQFDDDGDFKASPGIIELTNVRAKSEGIIDVYIWLVDEAGNYNYTKNSTVKIYFDSEPPVIKHSKVEAATSYVSINLYATLDDPFSNVKAAYIFYKSDLDTDYFALTMTHKGNQYEGQIPSHKVTGASLSYFLMALDHSTPENRIYYGRYGETYTNITASTDIDIYITDEDKAPPIISHVPVTTGTLNKGITITAIVHDDASGIAEVLLFYKSNGEDTYKAKTMIKSYSYYSTTIDSDSVTLDGIGYYIRARDSAPAQNTAYFGLYGQTEIEPDSKTDIDITVTTTDTSPPIITLGPIIRSLTESRAEIFWITDEPADSNVEYGLTQVYSDFIYDAELKIEHRINVTGLLADTLYHYRVSSVDADDNGPTYSSDSTFTTPAPGVLDTDGDGIVDAEDVDDDNDGIKDDWEEKYNLDPKDFTDADMDFDYDGFSNRAEYFAGTDPHDPRETPVGRTDIVPPTISHKAIRKSKPREAITLNAEVYDDKSGVKEVILFYRLKGATNYTQLHMGNKTPFMAIIPESLAQEGNVIEYYIYAADYAFNIKYYGSSGETLELPTSENDIDMYIKEFDEGDEDFFTVIGEPFGITDAGTCMILLIIMVIILIAIGYGVSRAAKSHETKLKEREAEERYDRRQREIQAAARRTGAYPSTRAEARSGLGAPHGGQPQDVGSLYQRDYLQKPIGATTAQPQSLPPKVDEEEIIDFSAPEEEEETDELEIEESPEEPEEEAEEIEEEAKDEDIDEESQIEDESVEWSEDKDQEIEDASEEPDDVIEDEVEDDSEEDGVDVDDDIDEELDDEPEDTDEELEDEPEDTDEELDDEPEDTDDSDEDDFDIEDDDELKDFLNEVDNL